MAWVLSAFGMCGMASCLASGVCAVGRVCCCALGASSGAVRISTKAAKAGYIVMIMLSSIFALALFNYGDQISFLKDISVINDICTNNGATVSQCFGASAVLRISLAVTVFFTLNIATAFSADAFVGCWGAKVVIWLVLIIGCFFIPANAITQYAQASRVFSILFILAMVIILIDAAYHLHEALTAKMEARDAQLRQSYDVVGLCQNCWRLVYLTLCAVAILASIVGLGILYNFSANRPEGVACGQNLAFLSITLISGLIYTVLSLLEWTGARGLLPPALVFAYCTWLCWSAINANADNACNPVPLDSSNTGSTIVGMLIAAASLCYTAFSAARSLPHLFDAKSKPVASSLEHADESDPLTSNAHPAGADKMETEEEEEDEESGGAAAYDGKGKGEGKGKGTGKKANKGKEHEEPYSVVSSVLFSVVLVLAGMYMAPVLTNWVLDPSQPTTSRSNSGTMWVNIASQWGTIIVYMWTLLAPALCPGRDFS